MALCLVTGGAGFIGSHLVTALVERGDEVRVLDDLSSGKRDNLAHIEGRYSFHDGSILSPEILAKVTAGVDDVFHLAAMVSVPKSIEQPSRCHELCATGTLNVLLAAMQAGAKRLVYSGTSALYGDSASCPVAEISTSDPMSPYAAGKLAGELYCQTFARLGRIETVRLRYFNVFGPRQDPASPYSGVISLFSSAMLAGKRPTILGDGLQTRDFIYVSDVVQANLLAASTPGMSGKVYNVGTGQRQTLIELVAAINRSRCTSIEPSFAPPRDGDVRHSQADITAARLDLGFAPRVTFDDGIAMTLDYFQSLA